MDFKNNQFNKQLLGYLKRPVKKVIFTLWSYVTFFKVFLWLWETSYKGKALMLCGFRSCRSLIFGGTVLVSAIDLPQVFNGYCFYACFFLFWEYFSSFRLLIILQGIYLCHHR